VEVSRTAVEARMTFGAFDVTQAVPYVPATVALLPASGRLTLDLRVKTTSPPTVPARHGRGRRRIADLTVTKRGAAAPLLRVPSWRSPSRRRCRSRA